MTLTEWVKLGTSLAGFAVSAGLFKWARRTYKHSKANREQYRLMQIEQSAVIMDEIVLIKKQLSPNGGSSLNDRITQVSEKIDTVQVQLEDLKTGQRNNREIMDVATWESDSTGRVTYVSSCLCELLGVTQADVMDFSWSGLIITEDRDRIFNRWKQSVETASAFDEFYTYQKPDGSFQKVHGKAIHNKGTDGKVTNSLGRLAKVGEPFFT